MTDDVAADILAMIRDKVESKHHPHAEIIIPDVNKAGVDNAVWFWRRKWLGTAHVLGASYRQLALLEKRSPQAILQAVNKAIPPEERATIKRGGKLSADALVWYWRAFYQYKDDLAPSVTPVEWATWLTTYHPYEGD